MTVPLDLRAVEARLRDDIDVNGGDPGAAALQNDTLALLAALRETLKVLQNGRRSTSTWHDWRDEADAVLVKIVDEKEAL